MQDNRKDCIFPQMVSKVQLMPGYNLKFSLWKATGEFQVNF